MRVIAREISTSVVAIVAFTAITSILASTQVGPPTTSERAIRDLADSALLAPPELAADALLKLIERGHIVDPKWKREVLETAWSLAPRAAYPFQIEPAVAAAEDSDPGSLSTALGTGLSTAAIQARIISQMVKLDLQETRNMFLQMSSPVTESPACSADRYASHRPYFEAMKVAAQTFSAEETKRGERFKFLAEGLRSLASPEDFELSFELLQSDRGLANNEFAQLMSSWSEMLAGVRLSDRLFSSRSIEGIATPLIYGGGKQVELRGGSMALALRAFRTYFVNHARASRCGESESKVAEEEGIRVAFNKIVAVMMPDVPLIKTEEIKPEGFGERAKVVVYTGADNGKILELKSGYSHLRFGSEEQQAINDPERRPDGMKPYLTIEQRSTPEWNDEALQFLNNLERRSKELGQSNREIFFQKAELTSGLVYAAPEGKLRQIFLDSYVKFLTASPIEHESPPEWAMWLNRLLGAAEIPDRRAWLDQIEVVGDSAVSIYCRLARLKLDSAH
jgi:hypothetical protein